MTLKQLREIVKELDWLTDDTPVVKEDQEGEHIDNVDVTYDGVYKKVVIL